MRWTYRARDCNRGRTRGSARLRESKGRRRSKPRFRSLSSAYWRLPAALRRYFVVPVDLLQEEQHGFGSKRRQIIGGGEGVYAGDPLDVQETVVERDGVLLYGCLGRERFLLRGVVRWRLRAFRFAADAAFQARAPRIRCWKLFQISRQSLSVSPCLRRWSESPARPAGGSRRSDRS